MFMYINVMMKHCDFIVTSLTVRQKESQKRVPIAAFTPGQHVALV